MLMLIWGSLWKYGKESLLLIYQSDALLQHLLAVLLVTCTGHLYWSLLLVAPTGPAVDLSGTPLLEPQVS